MSSSAIGAGMPIQAEIAPPEWLHLLPAGEVRTRDGRGPYRVRDMSALIALSMAGGKLVLDVNHATDLAAPNGAPSPAQGWIVELEARGDGLWGRIDWVDHARQSAVWRSYRSTSPVIQHDSSGAISAILRASLTNLPNFVGLATLHSKEPAMDLRSTLIKMLDLNAAADDRMILAKVAEFVKRYTGRDVAMMAQGPTTAATGQQLALQAMSYQRQMEAAGVTLTIAQAVRAVQDGKTTSIHHTRPEVQSAALASKALLHQAALARDGITIDMAQAVRAVQNGHAA